MHIFLVGLNTNPDDFKSAYALVSNVCELYPALEHGSRFVYKSTNERYFVISLTSGISSNVKRNYVSEDENHITLFSGLPIDPDENITGHDANQISKDFERFKMRFEGQASLIRFNKHNGNTEIISDILGMEQVYYYETNKSLILGNSISFISQTINNKQLDQSGLSYFLSLGWVASDRTLIEAIKVIKGGQRWVWDKDKIKKYTYFDISNIKPIGKETSRVKKDVGQQLTQDMLKRISIISKHYELECPLTGGFDSRILAALLINLNVNAEFYTSGNSLSDDVRIATKIAQKFNLRHKVFNVDDNLLVQNWDTNVKNFILQNDGMISLWQLPDIITNSISNKRTLRLTSHGATVAKVIYDEVNLYNRSLTISELKDYFNKRLILDRSKLLKNETIRSTHDYLNSFIEEHTNVFDVKQIPAIFFIYERIGRHHANQWNKTRHIADSFDLFCSKFYLSIAIGLSTIQKTTYPLHHQILKGINKDFLKIPLSGNRKFVYQNPQMHFYFDRTKKILKSYLQNNNFGKFFLRQSQHMGYTNTPVFNQYYWVNEKLPEIRSFILDQSCSDLWLFLRKDTLEKILSDPELSLQKGNIDKLLVISTLFYYENFLKQRPKKYILSGINNYL